MKSPIRVNSSDSVNSVRDRLLRSPGSRGPDQPRYFLFMTEGSTFVFTEILHYLVPNPRTPSKRLGWAPFGLDGICVFLETLDPSCQVGQDLLDFKTAAQLVYSNKDAPIGSCGLSAFETLATSTGLRGRRFPPEAVGEIVMTQKETTLNSPYTMLPSAAARKSITKSRWIYWSDASIVSFINKVGRIPVFPEEDLTRLPRLFEITPGVEVRSGETIEIGQATLTPSIRWSDSAGSLDSAVIMRIPSKDDQIAILPGDMFPVPTQKDLESFVADACSRMGPRHLFHTQVHAASLVAKICRETGLTLTTRERGLLTDGLTSIKSCGIVRSDEGLFIGTTSADGRIRWPGTAGFIPKQPVEPHEIIAHLAIHGRLRRKTEWPGLESVPKPHKKPVTTQKNTKGAR